MIKDILNNYVCLNPFNYIEVHKDKLYTCCPSWLNTPISDNIEDFEKSEILGKIQKSVLDGTYSYCNKELCPYLSELIYDGVPRDVIKPKENFNNLDFSKRISFCFDNSCNLSCPSCRKDFFVEDKKSNIIIEQKINDISNIFGEKVKSLSISGTSDPFASKSFRNFLINFDKTKFPKLTSIYLQTNGLLLNETLWNKMSKVNKLIGTIGVSVDAATKETYSIVRRGGNFDVLLKNLKFISSLKCRKSFSFVVQDTNYKEMKMFYDLIVSMNSLNNYNVFFSKINNWGTYTDDEYKSKCVFDENHPEFNEFLIELKKITLLYNVTTNMNDLIEKYDLKEKNTKLI